MTSIKHWWSQRRKFLVNRNHINVSAGFVLFLTWWVGNQYGNNEPASVSYVFMVTLYTRDADKSLDRPGTKKQIQSLVAVAFSFLVGLRTYQHTFVHSFLFSFKSAAQSWWKRGRGGSVHTKLKDRKFYFTISILLLGTGTKLLKYFINCL